MFLAEKGTGTKASRRMRAVPGSLTGLHAHAAHSAHAAGHCRAALVFVGQFGNHGFSSQHQAGDGSCVLQRRARYLRRIDDARFDEVFVIFGRGVEAEALVLVVANLLDYDRAFLAGVLHDLTQRLFERASNDVDADLLVRIAFAFLD